MVYCGKPSKGCAPCRSKRTKCDLALPSCTQCMRTGRICSGYRAEAYGEFRDQSKEVALRHSAQQRNQLVTSNHAISFRIHSQPDSDNTEIISPKYNKDYHPSPPDGLVYSEDTAAWFFFKDYVLSEVTISRPIFNELPGLYNNAPDGSALSCILSALGLASLSISMQRPEVIPKAHAKYAQALTAVNAALRNPILAKDDHTLLVVMLLGLYEENNTTIKSLEPWTNHVRGALALLDYRGTEQLKRIISLQLINGIRFQVLVNSLIRRVEVPATLLKWSRLSRDYELKDEVAESELADIMAGFCSLQAMIDLGGEHATAINIFEIASHIDSELDDWGIRWQPQNLYTTILVDKSCSDVFADYWHLYSDVTVASLWNTYRSIKILVNQIIIEQLAHITVTTLSKSKFHDPSIHQNHVHKSKRVIVALSHEICATIPYYMHHSYYTDQAGWDSAYGPKNTARAKLVIWQLYVAGQTDCVSDIMRHWVADQLIKIGTGMAIKKSVALGHLLKIKQRAPVKRWREIGVDD